MSLTARLAGTGDEGDPESSTRIRLRRARAFPQFPENFDKILLTYRVGLGDFSHVIAGAVETLYIVVSGEKSFAVWLIGFLLPALLGNIIGGVARVAVLNHAQVMAGGGGEDM